MKNGNNSEILKLFAIFVFITILLVFGLRSLQTYSIHNKRVCSYLGGLWERKEMDSEHRCYTYDELYN